MKKHFTTGLALLLPILLTGWIISVVINVLTQPFLPYVEVFISAFIPSNRSYFIFHHSDMISFLSTIIILFGMSGIICLTGIIGRLFLVDYFAQLGNRLLHQIPYFNKLYKICQDVVYSLFSSRSQSFSQVVLVPFPLANTLTLGLITKESLTINHYKESELVPVFIPGTPNPAVGFIVMFKKDQILFVDVKIEDAMKFVLSCGSVLPNFSVDQTCISK